MNTNTGKFVTINGKTVEVKGERNLLELIRRIGIELPTFCYHSELSAYGACRLCLVEVEKRGVMASCSTPPENGMVIHTDTKQLRDLRKINIELLLANHKRECPTCSRSSSCALQNIARRLGVEEIRYKQLTEFEPVDRTSPSLEHDPNKCILCGDCVRMCREVQGIGAIGFSYRGAKARVAPAFGQGLGDVECVNCGQCASVCPTGALVPKQVREEVWNAIHDEKKVVVAQIAPAVRVALAEYFDLPAGQNVAGQLVSALRRMGFDYVYDTTFSADMTIWEEAEEFLRRVKAGGPFPMFTSCCPAWVKFSEINFPQLAKTNVSSCKSPQQMFGSTMKESLPKILNRDVKDIVTVSIMPCTAKKFEAGLEKFSHDGIKDVDFVITTSEVGRMINSFGIKFNELEPEAFDMPFGFGTGAGLIFGTSGGVMEAALRYAAEKINGKAMHKLEFTAVRGDQRFKETSIMAGDQEIRIAVVNSLKTAREVAQQAAEGKSPYHFIEVMACPGGCVCGGGQPIQKDPAKRRSRMNALYQSDKNMQFTKSQENHTLQDCYDKYLGGEINSHKAHELLHTSYENRSDLFDSLHVVESGKDAKLAVSVCVTPGDTEKKGAEILEKLLNYATEKGLDSKLEIRMAFCPTSVHRKSGEVIIGKNYIDGDDFAAVEAGIASALK